MKFVNNPLTHLMAVAIVVVVLDSVLLPPQGIMSYIAFGAVAVVYAYAAYRGYRNVG